MGSVQGYVERTEYRGKRLTLAEYGRNRRFKNNYDDDETISNNIEIKYFFESCSRLNCAPKP